MAPMMRWCSARKFWPTRRGHRGHFLWVRTLRNREPTGKSRHDRNRGKNSKLSNYRGTDRLPRLMDSESAWANKGNFGRAHVPGSIESLGFKMGRLTNRFLASIAGCIRLMDLETGGLTDRFLAALAGCTNRCASCDRGARFGR